MINQDVCAYDGEVAIVPFGGVVIAMNEGARIASYLEPHQKVGILQNHGIITIGRLMIDEATWWSVSASQ